MELDNNDVFNELQGQRNQAMNAHAVASARAAKLDRQLTEATKRIGELEAELAVATKKADKKGKLPAV